jgi:hypothetical protein
MVFSWFATLAFFRSLSQMIGTNEGSIRNVFYGVLDLLFEVCSFGLISICGGNKHFAPFVIDDLINTTTLNSSVQTKKHVLTLKY